VKELALFTLPVLLSSGDRGGYREIVPVCFVSADPPRLSIPLREKRRSSWALVCKHCTQNNAEQNLEKSGGLLRLANVHFLLLCGILTDGGSGGMER
jgi:hypothetical protein